MTLAFLVFLMLVKNMTFHIKWKAPFPSSRKKERKEEVKEDRFLFLRIRGKIFDGNPVNHARTW